MAAFLSLGIDPRMPSSLGRITSQPQHMEKSTDFFGEGRKSPFENRLFDRTGLI